MTISMISTGIKTSFESWYIESNTRFERTRQSIKSEQQDVQTQVPFTMIDDDTDKMVF